MELLLADMKGQAYALPFLEHALFKQFKLWEMRDGRRLTAKAYTDMDRLGGALDAHAEEFFTKTLSVEEQSFCRQLLVGPRPPRRRCSGYEETRIIGGCCPDRCGARRVE
jgi:hypothetical protein